MRNLKDIITERLNITNNAICERLVLSKNKKQTLFPQSKGELKEMIESEIESKGNKCSLNHIDVSEITNMSQLFFNSEFNGDISKWDVSNVTSMRFMFRDSKFNGDISEWDVSNVTDMQYMFSNSVFDGDISKWDVSNALYMNQMFYGSKFTGENGDISGWDVSNVTHMGDMFKNCPLQNNPPKWYK